MVCQACGMTPNFQQLTVDNAVFCLPDLSGSYWFGHRKGSRFKVCEVCNRYIRYHGWKRFRRENGRWTVK